MVRANVHSDVKISIYMHLVVLPATQICHAAYMPCEVRTTTTRWNFPCSSRISHYSCHTPSGIAMENANSCNTSSYRPEVVHVCWTGNSRAELQNSPFWCRVKSVINMKIPAFMCFNLIWLLVPITWWCVELLLTLRCTFRCLFHILH